MFLEELERITARGRPESHRFAPRVGVRRIGGDVVWNGVAREEKDGDPTVVPLHCIESQLRGTTGWSEEGRYVLA